MYDKTDKSAEVGYEERTRKRKEVVAKAKRQAEKAM
jgi:hypothetical protein